jgi:class 3 adenylate cyclase/TolB-like protein
MESAMSEAPEGLHVDERRLAAILAADVAGYSRLMGRNEEGTVRELEAHQAVILPLIARHGGSIINIAGDGIVAQFPSAVRAVECAVAIQKIMAERNFDVSPDRRMMLRIGVNLGDIIHDRTRAYGDGINVAARLEPLAEPGGICISAPVREAIFGKLGLPLRDVGEKSLKNIARPVHVYEIQPPGARARRDWLSAGLRHYRRLAPALGVVVLLAALAGFGAWRFWPRSPSDEYPPIVAVLPFTNAATSDQDDFARSLTREVSAYLSTFPGMRIFAASDPGNSNASRESARQFGAKYALEGDVSKGADKARVTARLTDIATGESVWSDQYDFDGSDKLAIEAETVRKIYGALGGLYGKVFELEAENAWRKPDRDLTDFDYMLRAMTHIRQDSREGYAQAYEILQAGLTRFPDSPALKLRLAFAYVSEQLGLGPFADCREKFDTAWRYASEADKAKNTSRYLTLMSHLLMARLYQLHAGDFDRSVSEAEAAVEMAPNDAQQRSGLAGHLAHAGRFDEAIEWASQALLQPHNSAFAKYYKANLAWVLYLAGRYEDALENVKGSETVFPDITAAIYVRAGRVKEARATIADWLKTSSFSIATEFCLAIKEPMKSAYLDDLRKAGLPEK